MTSPGSPAQRYAAFRRARDEDGPELAAFRGLYDFELDDFQVAACRALAGGHGVLLAAPTGSGKTVVGEFAVHLALAQRRKCFYTTPIKALSNQKYADLVRRYSPAQVGLLTGDNSLNGEAPVVVMTTEVLRNMLYAGSPTLTGLRHVVLDEVHYLADRFRGAVWEEVIIHLPESVQLTALSATVSNAEEFGDWLTSVRGGTTVIVDEHRPVPLWQHMLAGNRLYDLFAARADGEHAEVNPELLRIAQREGQRDPRAFRPARHGARERGRSNGSPVRAGQSRITQHRAMPPRRADVIARLDRAGLLPAITFIFSRAGCDAAVRQCLTAGVSLTTPAEAEEIARAALLRTADIPAADRPVLGFDDWLAALRRGVAAHHAGLLPAFKEVTEELFAAGLIRAVFATETLALGINMPARTVVIEKLDKWNGESHAALTAGEYTQLTGRAGRRGIDVEGHAVVLWQPGTDPAAVAGLAGTRTYPLNSSFRPSYNMAVNLVGQVGTERAARLLESSFAQFQADRAVVAIARRARRIRDEMAGQEAICDRGDFTEYARLRASLSRLEGERSRERSAARRAAVGDSLRQLGRGDIIVIASGRRSGPAVVLEPDREGDQPSLLILNEQRQVRRLDAADCPDPIAAIDRLKVPGNFSSRSPQHKKDLASSMRNRLAGRDLAGLRRPARANPAARDAEAQDEIARLRRELRQHPGHSCPDRETHARQAEKYLKLDREAAGLEAQVAARSHVIARTFARVCAVLTDLGYLSGDKVTSDGRLLAGLYSELDLLAAECLRRGIWDDLDPAGLAACVSSLTYESRRLDDGPAIPGPASQPVRQALESMNRLHAELDSAERVHQLSFLRDPDPGLAWSAHAWATGKPLELVLGETLTPGDFIRAIKQLIDLLDQIAEASRGTALSGTARQAVSDLFHGVVAYTSVQ